jgi:hypothetical protein
MRPLAWSWLCALLVDAFGTDESLQALKVRASLPPGGA